MEFHAPSILLGLGIGVILAVIFTVINMKLYKHILCMIGKDGGYEKINGEWYRIIKCKDGEHNIFDDVGLAKRMHHED